MNRLSFAMAALALAAASGTASAGPADVEAGRQVYEATCARCHESGIMGAPLVSNPEEWTTVSKDAWDQVWDQHIEEGFLRTKGKKAVTVEDVTAASQYMMSVTQPN